ncbi:protein TRC8 homolog [Centruroides vittatus]|uniref:protein TRC8 homolog n=1 Tax=Centruroides vittatus TaxID=120091 RepID=UPI00350F8C3E
MELKSRIWLSMEIVLRIPPLFIMDAVLNRNCHHVTSYENYDEKDTLSFLWYILYAKVFLVAFCVSLFSAELLLLVYLWMITFGLVLWSYVRNISYVYEIEGLNMLNTKYNYFVQYSVSNFVLQCVLMFVFCMIRRKLDKNISWILIGISFLGPSIMYYLAVPATLLCCFSFLCAAVLSCYVALEFINNSKFMYEKICDCILKWRTVIRHYGIYNLIEYHWLRLRIPKVLRIFWTTRLVGHILVFMNNSKNEEWIELYDFWKQLVTDGCDTIIAVLGMTSVVSYFCCRLCKVIQMLLRVEDIEDRNVGIVSAILFLILALQTGLTTLQPEKRLIRLYYNVCLLFTAFLHFVHSTVNPVLLSLSATKNASVGKHIRALCVCTLLVCFPVWFVIYLWSHYSISTWLLTVTIFSVEVVVKAIITLMLYLLSLIDTYRSDLWEELDTYVYYIRAAGNAIEFLFSIFLFFNGGWMLLFESGGTIRACMICFHAYFNIWLQAKAGWNIIMKRKAAMKKITMLAEATRDQLRNYDDVCAICYQDMKKARITSCNHYYHGVCLWKWLYVQDLCPLCQTCLYTSTELQERGYDGRETDLEFNLIDWDDDD